jgi:hypothetical protein
MGGTVSSANFVTRSEFNLLSRRISKVEADIGDMKADLRRIANAFVDVPGHDLQGKECPICLDELLAIRGIISMTDCKHMYHRHCIFSALQHDPRCPLCRTDVPRLFIITSRASPGDSSNCGSGDCSKPSKCA